MTAETTAFARSEKVRPAPKTTKTSYAGQFLTMQDLEAMGFGCRQTVYKRLREGKLKAFKVGSNLRILGDSLDGYIAAHRFEDDK